ncbi:IS3 family transposase, partial [Burkholderia gladioli]|uniref:IS3 family transposase n=1 Tax=Burkholderia gladioli TaxID=28095 RepID=UPI001FC82D01
CSARSATSRRPKPSKLTIGSLRTSPRRPDSNKSVSDEPGAIQVVGWAMKPTLARELVLDALLMAIVRRQPKQSVLVHSDQGSQYGSDEWRRFCQSHKLEPSMSRRGNCWDNAVAESFFSSLKKERIRKRIYKTRDMARADVFDYIEVFYNRTRRHSHLGGLSPEAFEQAAA